MSIFDVLTMIGGLCLFLFGMDLMGQSLERLAGGNICPAGLQLRGDGEPEAGKALFRPGARRPA